MALHRTFFFSTVLLIAIGSALPSRAIAGMPRGAELSANEQDADPETGVTTALGNAELRIDGYRILGRADRIDVDPGRNEIQFTGHALITIGDARYESEQVRCSLDFETCAALTADAAAALPLATEQSAPQPWPAPAGSGATINP